MDLSIRSHVAHSLGDGASITASQQNSVGCIALRSSCGPPCWCGTFAISMAWLAGHFGAGRRTLAEGLGKTRGPCPARPRPAEWIVAGKSAPLLIRSRAAPVLEELVAADEAAVAYDRNALDTADDATAPIGARPRSISSSAAQPCAGGQRFPGCRCPVPRSELIGLLAKGSRTRFDYTVVGSS